jgi:hypothetical protein
MSIYPLLINHHLCCTNLLEKVNAGRADLLRAMQGGFKKQTRTRKGTAAPLFRLASIRDRRREAVGSGVTGSGGKAR